MDTKNFDIPDTDPNPRATGPLFAQGVNAALQVLGDIVPLSVLAKGAIGDDGHDDTAAFLDAGDELPANGGVILAPAPPVMYRVTSLEFAGKPVVIQGMGGLAQLYSSGEVMRAPVRIHSVSSNVTIVKFTDHDGKTGPDGIPGIGSGLRNIGVLGDATATNQTGVVVDNRECHLEDVSIGGIGGSGAGASGLGLGVFDCVSGSFFRVRVNRCMGKGILVDPTLGSGSNCAVTATSFRTVTVQGCGYDGWTIQGGVEGCSFDSCVAEGNSQLQAGGWDWVWDQVTGLGLSSPGVTMCRGENNWIENNATDRGGMRVGGGGNGYGNKVGFSHMGKAVHYDPGCDINNRWPYNDATLSGVPYTDQVTKSRTGGGRTPSEIDAYILFNRDQSEFGTRVGGQYIAATGMSPSDLFDVTSSSRKFAWGGGYNTTNGYGVRGRNQANTQDVDQIHVGSDDYVHVGDANGHSAGLVIHGSKVAFFDGAPVTKRTLPAAATDATTTQALANAIRQALIDYTLTG